MIKTEERIEFEKELKQQIAKRLREIREKHFESQGEAISTIDYRLISDNSAWSRYETGINAIPSIVYKELHDKWGVDLNWLIAGAETTVPELSFEVQEALSVLSKFCEKCLRSN